MKQNILLTSILFITFCIAVGCAQKVRVGGFYQVAVTKEEVVSAAAFAISANEKAMPAKKNGQLSKLKLVEILQAKEQIVAGVNYQLNLQVTVDGVEKQAEAVVWWQEWRKTGPYKLTTWKWTDQ